MSRGAFSQTGYFTQDYLRFESKREDKVELILQYCLDKTEYSYNLHVHSIKTVLKLGQLFEVGHSRI